MSSLSKGHSIRAILFLGTDFLLDYYRPGKDDLVFFHTFGMLKGKGYV